MLSQYIVHKSTSSLPRLPLEGSIDLTYRCNNTCRHCWLWLPETAAEKEQELSFDEIRRVADEARAMGCRQWHISGGEPMLRADFPEIFDLLTSRSTTYSINTNGTLITPAIAQQLRRKGTKMVALYGATAEVYDHVTRHSGGFEMAMRGIEHLKEAGAGFTVQLIPMRDNWHQWEEMIALAKRLSPLWRVGASWLCMSASGSETRNREIEFQRLAAVDAVALDPPSATPAGETPSSGLCGCTKPGDDRLFAACIGRSKFHIDPYGGMSFCAQTKDPALRFDLRGGSFRDVWEEFLPSLADTVRGGAEYLANCAVCDKRAHCCWCGAYAFIETGRHSARVPYLCAMAEEVGNFRLNWDRQHKRHYQIAGITVSVESDLPITDATFGSKFESFRVAGPGEDVVCIRHHFEQLSLDLSTLGQPVYRRTPWAIYQKGESWVYVGISPKPDDSTLPRSAVFNGGHTHGEIYSPDPDFYSKGDLQTLTMLPSDQIVLARVLADRQGFFLHSSGAVMNGRGVLFVGHSDAGKSTTLKLLNGHAEILCDDRNVVRRSGGSWWVHGSWSHGEIPVVSSASAPLRAIFFLRKSSENRLIECRDRRETLNILLGCLIRPLTTREWWEKTLPLVESLAGEIPCYFMEFDKSGAIVTELERLVPTL